MTSLELWHEQFMAYVLWSWIMGYGYGHWKRIECMICHHWLCTYNDIWYPLSTFPSFSIMVLRWRQKNPCQSLWPIPPFRSEGFNLWYRPIFGARRSIESVYSPRYPVFRGCGYSGPYLSGPHSYFVKPQSCVCKALVRTLKTVKLR